jgi:hypothetical protein
MTVISNLYPDTVGFAAREATTGSLASELKFNLLIGYTEWTIVLSPL